MENALEKLSEATRMLGEARTLGDIKHIVDIAEAARVYTRAAKLGLEAYNHAAEVKVRAERKAGSLLAEVKEENIRKKRNVETGLCECGELLFQREKKSVVFATSTSLWPLPTICTRRVGNGTMGSELPIT